MRDRQFIGLRILPKDNTLEFQQPDDHNYAKCDVSSQRHSYTIFIYNTYKVEHVFVKLNWELSFLHCLVVG